VDDRRRLGRPVDMDFTPYSRSAAWDLLTRSGVNKLDIYAKIMLGSKTGLGRKLREVCPEVDGGISIVSCLIDAHSKGFECLKNVETHPRYHTCTRKPIIKRALRDFYVNDFNFHKELVKCLSTTTETDRINEANGIVDYASVKAARSSEIDDIQDEKMKPLTYDVDRKADTRQCFYKLRSKVARCHEVASRCPKFRRCYEHPTIKTLKVVKDRLQTRYVHLMDKCLDGDSLREFDDDVSKELTSMLFPDNVIPEFGF